MKFGPYKKIAPLKTDSTSPGDGDMREIHLFQEISIHQCILLIIVKL